MPKIGKNEPKLVNRGAAGLLNKVKLTDKGKEVIATGPALPEGRKNHIVKALVPLIVDIASLTPDPNNGRLHPERNMDAIKASLRLYGQMKPIVVRKKGMIVVAGNGTMEAAKQLGWTKIAASVVEMTDVEAAGYGLADNRSAELAQWDFEVVARLEKLISEQNHGMVGWTAEEIMAMRQEGFDPPTQGPTLSDRFLVPPFSVLDARQGYWQDRKRQWLALGIMSELGRGDTPSTSARVGDEEQATS